MPHMLLMPRTLSEVSPAAQSVTGLMQDWDDVSCEAVDLALVEALTNIVRYGPPGETRPIGLEVDLRDDRVSVDIVDYVSPVPPGLLARAGNAAFDFDPDDLQSIPESGRGLALILLMMDEVTLHEEADLSRLRLVRHR